MFHLAPLVYIEFLLYIYSPLMDSPSIFKLGNIELAIFCFVKKIDLPPMPTDLREKHVGAGGLNSAAAKSDDK